MNKHRRKILIKKFPNFRFTWELNKYEIKNFYKNTPAIQELRRLIRKKNEESKIS